MRERTSVLGGSGGYVLQEDAVADDEYRGSEVTRRSAPIAADDAERGLCFGFRFEQR